MPSSEMIYKHNLLRFMKDGEFDCKSYLDYILEENKDEIQLNEENYSLVLSTFIANYKQIDKEDKKHICLLSEIMWSYIFGYVMGRDSK